MATSAYPQLSTGLADHLAGGGSLKSALDGGRIRVFNGTPPANPDLAATGTVLWTITVNGDGTGLTLDATAGNRGITKPTAAVWAGPTVAGTPTYWRFEAAGDDGSASSTAKRMQGSAGTSPADLLWIDANAPFVTDAAPLARTLKRFGFAWPA